MMQTNPDALATLMNSQTIMVCENSVTTILESDDFTPRDVDNVIESLINAVADKLEGLIYSDASQTAIFINQLVALLASSVQG
jgi:hypothetical protein